MPVPCVVIGRADAEVSDYYKVTAAAGQRLSFEIIGRRLGSQLDPQITLINAKTLRIEPALGIPREIVDEVIEKLDETLQELTE